MKKTLLNRISIVITENQRKRLSIIDGENFSVFIKHASKELAKNREETLLSNDEADFALKQYYSLAVLNPNNMHAVSASVDPYWHSHVLHTHAYADFCKRGIGYFMHHDPLDQDDPEKCKAVEDLYGYTLDILRVIYKRSINSQAWGNDVRMNRICWHFSNSSPATDAILPADPRFEEVRKRYSLA